MADSVLVRFKQSHSAQKMRLSARQTGVIKQKPVPTKPVVEPDISQEQGDIT